MFDYFDKNFGIGVFQGVFYTLTAFFAGYGIAAAIRDGFL